MLCATTEMNSGIRIIMKCLCAILLLAGAGLAAPAYFTPSQLQGQRRLQLDKLAQEETFDIRQFVTSLGDTLAVDDPVDIFKRLGTILTRLETEGDEHGGVQAGNLMKAFGSYMDYISKQVTG
jgi:hypothetical protein